MSMQSRKIPNTEASIRESIDPDVLKFYSVGEEPEVEISYKIASDLLQRDRLDIVQRYLYVQHYMKYATPTSIGEDLYWSYLVSSVKSRERLFKDGDGRKNSYQDYIHNFNEIIHAMRDGKFDHDREAFPVCETTVVGNAHRLAAAVYFDAMLPVMKVLGDPGPHKVPYTSLIRAGINSQQIDYIIQTYMRLTKRCHFLYVFPRGIDKLSKVEKVIGEHADIVYHKDILLTDSGKKRVVQLAYDHNEWWKSSLTGRFVEDRFPESGALRIYVVETKGDTDCVALKDEVRGLFSTEQPCVIHSSDTVEDALHYAQHLLNQNWIFFANHTKTSVSTSLAEKLAVYKERLEKGEKQDAYCIDSGAVMALHGLREADDIDYVCADFYDDVPQDAYTSNHNEEYKRLGLNFYEYIENPVHHFYFQGMKFMSLDTVAQFKFRRCSKKDIQDFKLISDFLNDDNIDKFEVQSRKQIRKVQKDLKGFEKRFKNLPPIRYIRRKMGKQVW